MTSQWFQELRAEPRIRRELATYMHKGFQSVSAVATQRKIDLRTAAFVLGIQRVGQAALSRGYTAEEINLS